MEESGSRSKGPVVTDMVCEDEEAESALASAHDQREEELQVSHYYTFSHAVQTEKCVFYARSGSYREKSQLFSVIQCNAMISRTRWSMIG